MADEDLYKQTLKLADADYAKQQPFLLQLMTTSNHRPYTYPEGRIDIPSGDALSFEAPSAVGVAVPVLAPVVVPVRLGSGAIPLPTSVPQWQRKRLLSALT